MPQPLDPALRQQFAARIRFYRELGIYDFYRREVNVADVDVDVQINEIANANSTTSETKSESPIALSAISAGDELPKRSAHASDFLLSLATAPAVDFRATLPEANAPDKTTALRLIREDLGDCTRCDLHAQGRKQIVFASGTPNAELMFIGEAPGADEDQQGVPFVGRSGQLLTNMIQAMGLSRQQVYIANIIKCRPPANRTPVREECEICSPFLMRQIDAVQPKAIVLLGAVAARTLLQVDAPMSQLRGQWFDFRGSKLTVTYHPAFLLRDPRQKVETWKDLQMVMKLLGLKPPPPKPGT